MQKDSIVFYGGDRARELIEIIPNKAIMCIVANDLRKQGSKIRDIDIVSPKTLYSFKNEIIVVLTFFDDKVEEELRNNHINFKYACDVANNFFNEKKYIDYLDDKLYSSYLWDKRMINGVKIVNIEKHWRHSFLSHPKTGFMLKQ